MVSFSAGYVYGVMCSDGKFVWNEKYGNYSISLETSNVQFSTMFTEHLSKIVNKAPRSGTHKRRKGNVVVHMNMVTLYGKSAIESLSERWGMRFGDWNTPKASFDDEHFRRGFLRGFCDGNGSVSVNVERTKTRKTKKRSIILYSMNRGGLANIGELLRIEGIGTSTYPAGECFALKITGKTRLELFRDRVGFGLDEKKNKLDEALMPLSAE
jgi:intein-encoded DNA endonuclease-like protein